METSPGNGAMEGEEGQEIQEEDERGVEDVVSPFTNPSAMYVLSRKKEKRKITCNVILTAITFMLHYTATLGTSILQSTINGREGLGVLSLATFHATSICCKLFSPFVLRRLDPKRMMTVTFLTVVPYLVAQLYPMFLTLVPAAILYGMGAEILWTALYIYMFSEAWIYSQLSEVPIRVTIGHFFILFFVISNWSLIWSGAVPYVVLLLKEDVSENEMPKKDLCGYKFCPEYIEQIPMLKRPSEESIGIIMYIFMACTVLAFIISFMFIKSLTKYHDEGLLGKHQKHRISKYLSNIVIFFKDCQHMLVLPLMLWFGMMRAFMIADLTQSFIACNHGIAMVGLTTITAGVAKLVVAFLIGIFARFNRNILFVLLVAVNFALYFCLLQLNQIGKNIPIILVIVIVWNIVDSIWIIQLNKILPSVFHRQKFSAMDANMYMQTWQNLGSAIMYCLSSFICTREKLYFISGIMVISTVGYIMHCLITYFRTPSTQEEDTAARSVLPFQ